MPKIRKLLYPFSWLYGLVVKVRNYLFDKQILVKSHSFEMPIIGIGNLSAGGTGKTPMAEYVLRILLENDLKPALLSRGYRRSTKGFGIVKSYSDAAKVGDEPYQIKRKHPEAVVVVCEDRVEGVQKIREEFNEIDVIVLDDCYQHRKLKTGLSILLTDFNKPFFKDKLLPVGMLREPQTGKVRADIIVVTKCPQQLGSEVKQEWIKRINPAANQSIFFTSINYQSLIKVDFNGHNEVRFPIENIKGYEILLFTGIANPKPLQDFLSSWDTTLDTIIFPDHHKFNMKDMEKIKHKWESIKTINKLVLTTEKDWRRLENTKEARTLHELPVYFLPIEVGWEKEEKSSFDNKILEYVRANKTIG
ncbi:MAG: tetraacyldisaccharide 4'-kinase [Bacteroidia bacterium]